MKKKIIKSFFLVSIVLGLNIAFTACSNKDKEIVLSQDVSKDVKEKEVEIQRNIELGNKNLNEGKFEEARKNYENAISLDSSNGDTYLKIKDKYLEKNRLDDAYYIIKLAINNKVDTENMKTVLENIKGKFGVSNIEMSAAQNESFVLPKEVTIKVNDVDTKATVKWNKSEADTSKLGTFEYDGVAEQYGKPVKLTLTVKAIVKAKKIGFVKQVYDSNGKRYIKFDEVEFYSGDKALQEAKKDKSPNIAVENGKEFLYNDYYLRNSSTETKNYEVSKNATFKLMGNLIGSQDVQNKAVGYEELKNTINRSVVANKSQDFRAVLCWINTENDIVVSIESQYTP
jgi:tetratricopeptide (TPR) repeat protein